MSMSSNSQIDESAFLGILQHLDKEQLQALINAEEKLLDLINDDSQVKRFEQDKEMLITSNKSLAEYNLSLQPKIHQGREGLAYSYERAAKLKEEYDVLRSQVASQNQAPSLETAYDLLRFAAQESEEQTDAVGEALLDREMDCDNFLKTFIEARTDTHLLKIKAEKLGEMMSRGRNASSHTPAMEAPVLPSRQNLPPLNSQPPRPSAAAPYPMYGGAGGMPQASHYLPRM